MFRFAPLALAATLLAMPGCFPTSDDGDEGDPPRITLFEVSPASIPEGGVATLRWSTTDADSVQITTDDGSALDLGTASAAAGSTEVGPLVTTTYTLVAQGSGSASQSLTLTVTPPQQPEILSFTSSASDVYAGGEITLSWQTLGATDLLLQSDAGGSVTIAPADVAAGSTPVVVAGDVVWTLTATSQVGQVSAEVTIATAAPPVIESFTATPATPVDPGGEVLLAWTVSGATGLALTASDGTMIQQGLPLSGTTSIFPVRSETYLLTAEGVLGDVTASLLVEVRPPAAPTVDSFVATPPAIAAGGSTTLAWATRGGTSLEVRDGAGGLITSATAAAELAAGSVTVSPTGATSYVLTVRNDLGDQATAQVFVDLVQGPVVSSFTASPSQILRTAWASLAWSVTDDQLGVSPTLSLSDDGGNTYDLSGAGQIEAAYPVQLLQSGTVTFTLTATTPGMPSFSATATVEVFPPAQLDSFQASPSTLDTQGGAASPTSTLSWTTRGAQGLELFALDAAANVIVPALYSTSTAAEVASGSIVVQPPIVTSYRVIATGALGSSAAGDLTVEVLPELLSFTSSAVTIPAGASVTLDWSSHAAQSTVLGQRTLPGGSPVNQSVASTGSMTLTPTASQEYTLCANAGSNSDCQTLVVRVVQPGALMVSEIMMDPAAVTDDLGEWFEVVNTSTEPIDLAGWTIEDHRAPYLLPTTPLVIAPGGFLVFARRGDSAVNGGVTVDHVYGTVLSLRNTDGRLAFLLGGVAIDTVVWDTATGWPIPTGGSLSLLAARYGTGETSNDNPTDWCLSSSVYGDGDLGTPGSAPVACGGGSGGSYLHVPNAGIAFVDISSLGTLLTGAYGDDVYTQTPSGLAFTMPFFGNTVSDLWVSSNGFVSFQDPGTAAVTNTTIPSTAGPNTGVVAAFWDDLNVQVGATVHVRTTGAAGSRRTIVQWSGFTRYGQTGTLTFQIQLFETGDIALVYDQASGTTGFDGSGATLGIEAIGGTEGLLDSFNSVGAVAAGDSILFQWQ